MDYNRATFPKISSIYNIRPKPTQVYSYTDSIPNGNGITQKSTLKEDLLEFYHGALDIEWIIDTERIPLALDSGLHNEIEWALEILLEWSYFCPKSYDLQDNALLYEKLIEFLIEVHNEFVILLNRGIGTFVTHKYLTLVLILRNFSLLKKVSYSLSSNEIILGCVDQILLNQIEFSSFSDTQGYPELFAYYFDIFENLCSSIDLREEHFIFLEKCLNSFDRFKILMSVRCISRILIGKDGEKCKLYLQNKTFILRIIQLIALPLDQELVVTCSEFLSLYAYCDLEEMSELFKGLSCNPIHLFLNVLKGHIKDEKDKISNTAKSSTNDKSYLRLFQTWIAENFKSHPKSIYSMSDLYSEFCTAIDTNIVQFMLQNGSQLAKIVISIFPSAKVVHRKIENKFFLFFEGIYRVSDYHDQIELNLQQISLKYEPNNSLPLTNGTTNHTEQNSSIQSMTLRHYVCLWPECGHVVLNKAELLSHFRHIHAPIGDKIYHCYWDNCQEYPDGLIRTVYIEHFKDHLNKMTAKYDLSGPALKRYLETYQEGPQVPRPKTSYKPVEEHEVDDDLDMVIPQVMINLLKKLSTSISLRPMFRTCTQDILSLAVSYHPLSKDLFEILYM